MPSNLYYCDLLNTNTGQRLQSSFTEEELQLLERKGYWKVKEKLNLSKGEEADDGI